ncbi:hypothetical protein EZV62_016978 [Acer yangbiense]|uniref:AAA+ ATPase domain-containing protein n=1 Tax=Acer yangbiense TaxID=1000413 RepID=A0A5C7HQQ5_9ROSI|nr:hypothetical protein EZV62_016978 [Acer yangbiense]
MAEICISIASKVAEYLVDPILQPICYAFKYQRYMEELKRQVKKLTNERESVQHSVDEAKGQGDEIEKHVQEWLESVDEFAEKVAKPIIDDQVKVKKLCSIGFCPSLMTRYSLSKKAVKTAKDGVNLLGEGKFQKVSYRLPPRRTNSIYIKGYEDFASRMSLSKSIMEALADADANLIGVYGMGGVGKTTLVKKVAQQAKENKLFDVVVTAEVTETPEIRTIQGQIADELGLIFQEESVPGRAARLRERMKKENRILVILDNVWAKLDLESIGIPMVGDEKGSIRQKVDQEEGENANKWQCKIVFTSRNLDVLRNDMDTQKNFKVEILSDTEGESLFWKTVGYSEEKSDLNPTAVEIVGKCGGLPVAIKTIANALKNKSLPVWKNALDQLKKANPKDIKGMNADVYSTIELSFNLLENEEAKSLFLFCSLCNGGYGVHITDLLKYSMGLSLFQDFYTLEEGRNKLHTLIDYLKSSCLLMDDDSDLVKMHDIIHAVSVSISSTTKLWFNLQDAAGLKEALGKKLPEDSAAVSLLYRDIYELPEKMVFPKLEQFLLYMEDASLQIPDAVFEGMKGLKVLDMSGIHLLSPPSSLICLINLRTLCLDRCRFEDVAFIGELKELEILSLMDSDIEQLPREIGQLARLRLLDLSHCSKLKVIKPNVISSLTRLEELYMGDSFDQWDMDGQRNASLAELKQLSYLKALDIHVSNARIIPQGLSFEKLERYRIFVGEVWDWSGKYETSRTLKLKLSSSIYLSNEIKSLLNRTQHVYLDKLKGVKNVVYELSGEGFPQLKHLYVQNGSDIQYIANSFGCGLCNVFPRLESLFLDNLINLEKICHGPLATKFFSKLRIVKVRNCDRLKHLFSFSMVNNLSQLQEIEVINCEKLEEIISKESMELVHQNESIRRIEFTQLHTLTLECLPQITSFSFNASTPDIGSQEIVAEDEADGFMSLFSQNVVLPSLKNLKLSSINIRCTWLDQLPVISSCCQALTNLTLEQCNYLKFLFSYSMVRSLVQLQKLEIRNCNSIEGIINTEELRGKEKVIMMVFPKLLNLQLQGLPKLSRFGSGNSVEFRSLTQISIEDCPNLKTFFSSSKYADIKQSTKIEEMNSHEDIYPLFDEKVVLPTLASINLSSIRIQTIWHNQLQPMSPCFQNLKEIIMDGCDTVKHGFPSSMVESLVQLEVLKISNCKLMEVVTIAEGGRVNNTLFTKLHRLHLNYLPELTTFCNFAGKLIELTSLAELLLVNCPKMHAFVSNSPHADMPAANEEQINSEKNLHSHIQPFFDEKVELPTLAILYLYSSIASQTIWHNQLQAHSASFHNLAMLVVNACNNLKYLFPFSVAESLNNLEVLEIYYCKLMEGVITTQGERKSSTLFPKLRRLNLDELPELIRFYNFNGNSIELPSLSELIIYDCPKMQTFASNSLPGIEEPEKVNTDTEENSFLPSFFDEKVSLSCLKKLKLRGLPEVLCLLKENSQPSKVFEILEYLEVSSCGNLKNLVPSSLSLQTLETLEVRNCDGLISLVTFSTAKSLEQLKRMEIIDCKLIEEIIIDTGDEIKDGIVFNQLKYLDLQYLPSLTSFCKGNFTIEFPYLQRVLVIECLKMMNFSQGVLSTPKLQSLQMGRFVSKENEGCWEGDLNTTVQKLFRDMVEFRDIENFTVSNFPHLKEIWHKKLLAGYFGNLKSLVVDDKYCSLRYIFTPSLALGLAQLQDLEIKNCVILEVITVIGEETISNTMFPNLNCLKLINLPNLTCFCNFTGNSIELPSLIQLSIENCPNMETFISNFPGVDMSTSKDNCHTDIQPLFDEKVGLPYLMFLRLDKMDKLRKIWHHRLNLDSFCKLYSFGVRNCHNVLNVIPSNMLGRLQKLDELRLINCSLLCEIFELQASSCGKTQAITATQLEKLVLYDLPKLKHIWDVDSQGLLTCQNLISIEVTGCGSLKSIFPASVGRNLLLLEKIWIDDCCMVEEIFANEEQVDEAVPRFPQLTILRLAELPQLRSFYPRVHISEWPMLKKLQVWNCDKVEVSASHFLRFQVTHEMPLDQPLLLFDKVPLTNLESLGLDWKWFEKEALHEKLPEYSCKLNFLTIKGFQKGADICVFCFLHRLPNLDKLQVSGGFFKGLFLCEGFGCEEKHVETPSKLSHLRLVELNDSLHLWEENSLSSKGFQNLAILEVVCCSNIKSLVSSSVSFQNLTRLEVLKCNELLNLVAVPIAKCLMQLTELSISKCKMVEEIIIHEGDEVKDRIIFKKLRNLELKCLPSLTSFYPGSYTTVFPSLQQVVVTECPNMKIFSRGVLSTPKLHKLQTTKAEGKRFWKGNLNTIRLDRLQTTEEEGKGFWKGNLNTTIEHLFIESSKGN